MQICERPGPASIAAAAYIRYKPSGSRTTQDHEKQIIEQHGGQIRVESAQGKGAPSISRSPEIDGREEGRIEGALSIGRDIRERKRFEEELKKKVDELEKWYRLTIDREVKMTKLKKRSQELESN